MNTMHCSMLEWCETQKLFVDPNLILTHKIEFYDCGFVLRIIIGYKYEQMNSS